MANDLDNLSPQKRAVLELMLREKRSRRSGPSDEFPAAGKYPLSWGQRGLWLLQQWEPKSTHYNVPIPIRLKGERLRIDLLERALTEIVRRHHALRTRFEVSSTGDPVQVLTSEFRVAVQLRDLPDASEAVLEASLREEVAKPFDLANDRLLRVVLFRLAEDEHVLLIVTHHIVFDGASLELLFSELEECYRATIEQRPHRLPEPAAQYDDFVRSQARETSAASWKGQIQYWKRVLEGPLPRASLPTDYPRPARQSFRGARHFFNIPARLVAAANEFSSAERSTPYMVLLAAFYAFLYRSTGQTDLIVGSPTSNRTRVEFDSLIGLFMNPLALRTAIDGDITFRQFVHKVRSVALAAYANSEVPFEMVVNEVRPERDFSRPPVFQTMFSMFEAPRMPEFPGVHATFVEFDRGTSKFDLTLTIVASGDDLQAAFEYSVDLFAPATIEAMARDFLVALDMGLWQPDLPITGVEQPAESVVKDIWMEILGVPDVAPDDNFFHLGGHSLTAFRVTTRVNSIFNIQLDHRTIFDCPTLAEFSACVFVSRKNC